MIKANELRLGNLVSVIGYVGPVTQIISEAIVRVGKPIDSEDCEQIGTALFELVRPIPLTAEWLERFGFKWSKGDKTGNIFYDKSCGENRENICFLYVDNEFRLMLFYNIQFKYVHQLQNLYFALTGEELTLKTETV